VTAWLTTKFHWRSTAILFTFTTIHETFSTAYTLSSAIIFSAIGLLALAGQFHHFRSRRDRFQCRRLAILPRPEQARLILIAASAWHTLARMAIMSLCSMRAGIWTGARNYARASEQCRVLSNGAHSNRRRRRLHVHAAHHYPAGCCIGQPGRHLADWQ